VIPPPTAVTNESAKTPVRFNPLSMAIMAPVILNDTRPMESLMMKNGLFSMLWRL